MSVPIYPPPELAEHREGFVHARDHLRLYWQCFTPRAPRATVIVCHGAGDHSGRYPALATALVEQGFEAALVDLRGHGQSDGRRWYVDAFGDYLADWETFHDKLRTEHPERQRFVVGHSQGALVAALWGMGREAQVAGFVLASPFFGLARRPPVLKVAGARVANRILPWLPFAAGIAVEDLTSDPEMQAWTTRDHLYGRVTTPRWFFESRRACAEALRRAPEFAAPLLVLAAGDDRLADLGDTRRFVESAGSGDKGLIVYDGFRHELFNERERARPIGEAVAWISARTRAPRG